MKDDRTIDPEPHDPTGPSGDANGAAAVQRLDLVNGPIFPTAVKLALPVVMSNLLNLGLGMADMIMVGRIGKEALAALVISNTLMMLLFAIGFGTGFATITFVSQHTGAGRHKLARRAAAHALMFAMMLGLVMIIVGNLFLPDLMSLFNAEEEVTRYAISYTDVMFDWMPFFFLLALGVSIMQGLGDTVTPLIIMVAVNLVNILINYVLIFGAWGFPRLGIVGAAIGSVAARMIGSMAIFVILTSGKYRMVLRPADFRPCVQQFWGILRLGVPNSLQSLLRNVNVMILYRILSLTYQPTVAQASLGVGFGAEGLAFIPLLGLNIATGAMVGQNLGAGKPDRAEQAAWATLKTGFVLMTVACLAFLLIPGQIIALFTGDPDVIEAGSWYLRINAITQIFQACFVLVGCMRGAGDSINPLLAHIAGQWIIRLPLAFILATMTGLEEWGVWLAMATSSAIESTAYFWLFRRGHWKKIRVRIDSDV